MTHRLTPGAAIAALIVGFLIDASIAGAQTPASGRPSSTRSKPVPTQAPRTRRPTQRPAPTRTATPRARATASTATVAAPAAPPATVEQPRAVVPRAASVPPAVVATRPPDVHLLSVESYAISRVDDNVNRDPVGVTSVGMIGGGTIRYASSAVRPLLTVEYDAALHRYTTTSRFDRFSQRGRAVLSKRVVKWWTVDLLTEVALRGSGEDRDVSDQLLLLPQTTFRLDEARRLRFAFAQRWRRFPTDTLQNAANRYLLAEYRQRRSGGGELEAEARVEENVAVGDRFDFGRASVSASYAMPVTKAITFEAGMRYRRQRYAGRFVELNDVDVARVDHRLEPSAAVRVRIGASEVLLSYEPEWRRSNDPDKKITQNLWQLGVRRRWY